MFVGFVTNIRYAPSCAFLSQLLSILPKYWCRFHSKIMIRIRIICLKIRTFHELLKYNFTSSPEKCVRHPHLLCISHCQVADFIWNTSVNKYFGRYSISLNNFWNKKCSYRVIFFIGTPLKMSLDWHPPNLHGLAPP